MQVIYSKCSKVSSSFVKVSCLLESSSSTIRCSGYYQSICQSDYTSEHNSIVDQLASITRMIRWYPFSIFQMFLSFTILLRFLLFHYYYHIAGSILPVCLAQKYYLSYFPLHTLLYSLMILHHSPNRIARVQCYYICCHYPYDNAQFSM